MSWILAFIGFAALIVLHEFGHFVAAKAVGMRVERFALFFPPLLWKIRRGETEYGIGALPFGGYVRISGMNPDEDLPPEVAHRAYYRQPAWKRIVVIAAGPFVNVLIAFLLIWGLYVLHGTYKPTTTVAEVTKGAAAATVLVPGDRVVAVDGVEGDFETMRAQIQRHRCADGAEQEGCAAATAATLTYVRNGQTRTASVRPRYDAAAGRMLIGYLPEEQRVRAGPVAGVGQAADQMWFVTKATVGTIGRLFYDSRARKEVSSVAGAYKRTHDVIQSNQFAGAAWILAVISLSLAIINLFPFLPLDGGHIFWAVAEKVRGRPIDFRILERASVVGFVLVLALFAIGLSNDISWFTAGSPAAR